MGIFLVDLSVLISNFFPEPNKYFALSLKLIQQKNLPLILFKIKFLYLKKNNHMENVIVLSQIIISISILIVWVFRYDNIVIEFKQYGLSNLLRNIVGASKISLATILVIGIWHPEYLFAASTIMAFLMLCAQFFHFRAKNDWIKFMPSLSLLILSLFIASSYY